MTPPNIWILPSSPSIERFHCTWYVLIAYYEITSFFFNILHDVLNFISKSCAKVCTLVFDGSLGHTSEPSL